MSTCLTSFLCLTHVCILPIILAENLDHALIELPLESRELGPINHGAAGTFGCPHDIL